MGATLPVGLDEGVDLNAYYDRAGLAFFHRRVAGTTVYSGESPDVLCHELGHAVLDAMRPQLWNAASIEVAAFHESFGDISAILSAMQLRSVREAVVKETAGRLYRSSRVSRLAEQLGWAIRQFRPDVVEPDCLRNAVNSFFYRDPATLPPSAPASGLSSEPHSFSRVFTAAFFEGFAGMLPEAPTEGDLRRASHDAARLLVDAVVAAPVVPDYLSQVAAHVIDADTVRFAGKHRDGLTAGFVRHGILSLASAVAATGAEASAASAGMMADGELESPSVVHADLPRMALPAAQYGLSAKHLFVEVPGERRRFAVAAAALDVGAVSAATPESAAGSFLEDLFRRGRVDVDAFGKPGAFVPRLQARKTHRVIEGRDGVMLVRRLFDCGFDVLEGTA